MDKATKIADAIWKLSEKYLKSTTAARCIEGLETVNEPSKAAKLLSSIWMKKIDVSMIRFQKDEREGLGRELAYIVLLSSVTEFLEKTNGKK